MHPATNPYQAQSVATASPAQLVTMLYDRALVAIGRVRAQDRSAPGALEVVNTELQRAQDIVTELRLALDHDRGGEIAQHLDLLYDFCLDRLLQANLHKDDPSHLDGVEKTLRGLREAWDEACVQQVPVAV